MSYLGRLLFFILFLWSAAQAWASISYEQGHYALQNQSYVKAQDLFSQSLDRGFLWPDTYYDLGYSLFFKAKEKRDFLLLEEALEKIEKAKRLLPLNGKYLIYEARIKLQLKMAEGALNQVGWQEIEKTLKQAYDLKGANLWIPFQVAKLFLTHQKFLSENDIEWAFRQLRLPCEIVPGYYLESALKFLLEMQVSPEWLAKWLPQDYKIHFLAVQYFAKHGAWDFWKALYPQTLTLKAFEKERVIAEVAQLIQKGRVEEAYTYLETMHWVDEGALDFKVFEGLLQFQMKRLGLAEKEALIKNLQLFLEKDNSLGPFSEFGRIFVHYVNEPLLEALLAYRQGDMGEAVRFFNQVKEKSSNIEFLNAKAFLEINQKDKAVSILKESLQDKYSDIDLRNLNLLINLMPEMKPEVDDLKAKNTIFYRPVSAWSWSQGLLHPGRDQGMIVNLDPGKSTLFFSAKKIEEKLSSAFVVARLSGDYIGSFWITRDNWDSFHLAVQTEGGRFWLSFQVMNAEGFSDVVQLGELRVRS